MWNLKEESRMKIFLDFINGVDTNVINLKNGEAHESLGKKRN